jgi:hypothetical protein
LNSWVASCAVKMWAMIGVACIYLRLFRIL